MPEKKQYFNEINIMRGMAVLCVVIGHSFDATDTPSVLGFLKSFVYCFHMPAFFFISGFLLKDQKMDWKEKTLKIRAKAKRLMIPYLFLTLVTIGLKAVFGVFAKNPLNYSTLLVDILIGRNNPNGGLWFLYALFIISIVGILFNELDKRILFLGAFCMYLVNSFVLHWSGYILSFFLDYAWYFFAGCLIRKYCFDKVRQLNFLYTTTGKILTMAVTCVYIMIAFVRIYVSNVWILKFTVTVMGVLLLFVIAVQVNSLNKGKNGWMLIGEYGMDIYMIGYYVQQGIYVILGKILGIDYVIYAWCMCILGLVGSILISKYIVRKNKIFSLLILGR